MTTLHMKTEEVRNAAHQLDLAVGDLYFKAGKLKSAAGSLRSAWQGGKSNYYANQLQQMGNTLHEEVVNLQRLVKRMYGEVGEWENADSNGGVHTSLFHALPNYRFPSSVLNQYAVPLILLTPPLWEVIGSQGNPVGSTISGWNPFLKVEVDQAVSIWTKSQGWHEDEPKLGISANIGVIDGAFAEDEGSSNWEIGGVDVGGTVGSYGVSQWEGGARIGLDEKGGVIGAYAEYDLAEVTGAMLLGSSMLGITLSGAASAGSAEAFAGYKDGTVGASVGASAAAGEVGLGLNVAGLNVGVDAGLSAGVEFGIKFGKETEVKVGPFKVGLSFGKAISD